MVRVTRYLNSRIPTGQHTTPVIDLDGIKAHIGMVSKWSGKMNAATQRALFGVFMGKGTIAIRFHDDGTGFTVEHCISVCFGTDWDVTARIECEECRPLDVANVEAHPEHESIRVVTLVNGDVYDVRHVPGMIPPNVGDDFALFVQTECNGLLMRRDGVMLGTLYTDKGEQRMTADMEARGYVVESVTRHAPAESSHIPPFSVVMYGKPAPPAETKRTRNVVPRKLSERWHVQRDSVHVEGHDSFTVWEKTSISSAYWTVALDHASGAPVGIWCHTDSRMRTVKTDGPRGTAILAAVREWVEDNSPADDVADGVRELPPLTVAETDKVISRLESLGEHDKANEFRAMVEAEPATPVVFYVEDGAPLAVFPTHDEGRGMVSCYAHMGQHSTCQPSYARSLPLATPEQYAPLRRELESAPYRYRLDIHTDWDSVSRPNPAPVTRSGLLPAIKGARVFSSERAAIQAARNAGYRKTILRCVNGGFNVECYRGGKFRRWL